MDPHEAADRSIDPGSAGGPRGQQFRARFLRTSAPTSVEGIEKYLASGMIRGIGPVYAKKLIHASS
jgi:hypothetical protein